MKMQNLILLSFFTLMLAACSTNRITSDYERGIDFSQYKTYKILDHKHGFPVGTNPINKQRIERAIQHEMKTRGFQTSEDPDLLVAWFVKVETHQNIDSYGPYYGQWRRIGYIDVNWYEYKVGTLVIDFVDAKQKQVVWHGATSGVVEDNMKNVEEKINKAVHAMFERYYEETGQGAVVPSLAVKD